MKLQLGTQRLEIDGGELISYQVNDHEYIHQKGSPGWRNSDTEMFPIIGPTADAGFQVQTPRDVAIQDQHGLLREMDYDLVFQNATELVYRKTYVQRTPIKNSKYPEKSNQQFLYWTYDFQFEKKYTLSEKGLEISFIISGEKGTPFMLGYHPAFNLVTKNPSIIANENEITLKEVLKVGSRALHVPNCSKILLKDKHELIIETEGFENFMLWTEVPNMICIEPITFYPYDVKQQHLNDGFQYLKEDKKVFTIHIALNS